MHDHCMQAAYETSDFVFPSTDLNMCWYFGRELQELLAKMEDFWEVSLLF